MGESVVREEYLEAVVKEEQGKAEEEKDMVLRWEKFLPSMIVRVLLVEFDDSTRQIIAALLRKCSYKVAAVQDGKKAWEILKEKPRHFNLVLTEVSLPTLSGFDLLSLISGHPICKNIPVIMMSSHDSINIVFKCMLKGAVDFLVKPLRKNELRNLWQHVWRRRSLHDGVSGFQIRNTAENKIEAVSDNSSTSSHSSDYVSSMHMKRESNAKESDTQSSCTRPDMEDTNLNMCTVEEFLSSQKEHDGCLSRDDEAKDKFTTQVAQTKPSSQVLESMANMDMQDDNAHARHLPMGENIIEVASRTVSSKDGESNQCNSKWCSPPEAIDFLGQIGKGSPFKYVQKKDISVRLEECNGSAEASIPKENNHHLVPAHSHEISLKRPRLHDYPENGMDDMRALNHSDASPFLRYNSESFVNALPVTCLGSEPKEGENCSHTSIESQCNGSQGIVFSPKPRRCNTLNLNEASTNSRILCQSRTASPERIATVEQANKHFRDTSRRSALLPEKAEFPCSQVQLIPVSLPVANLSFDGLSSGYGTILQPLFYAQEGPPFWSPISSDRQEGVRRMSIQQSDPSPSHKIPPCPGDQDAKPPANQLPNNADASAETDEEHGIASASSQSRSSLYNCSMKYYNMNTVGCVSNGNSGKTTNTTKCGVEGLFSHSGIGEVEYNRSVQRNAALAKFRMKRKERCFEKKVRYESRKILAEQRPRVKGQFVRQVHHESSNIQ